MISYYLPGFIFEFHEFLLFVLQYLTSINFIQRKARNWYVQGATDENDNRKIPNQFSEAVLNDTEAYHSELLNRSLSLLLCHQYLTANRF